MAKKQSITEIIIKHPLRLRDQGATLCELCAFVFKPLRTDYSV
jgi:hypothetical protein